MKNNNFNCSNHPNKKPKRICLQCNLLICNDCAINFHSSHIDQTKPISSMLTSDKTRQEMFEKIFEQRNLIDLTKFKCANFIFHEGNNICLECRKFICDKCKENHEQSCGNKNILKNEDVFKKIEEKIEIIQKIFDFSERNILNNKNEQINELRRFFEGNMKEFLASLNKFDQNVLDLFEKVKNISNNLRKKTEKLIKETICNIVHFYPNTEFLKETLRTIKFEKDDSKLFEIYLHLNEILESDVLDNKFKEIQDLFTKFEILDKLNFDLVNKMKKTTDSFYEKLRKCNEEVLLCEINEINKIEAEFNENIMKELKMESEEIEELGKCSLEFNENEKDFFTKLVNQDSHFNDKIKKTEQKSEIITESKVECVCSSTNTDEEKKKQTIDFGIQTTVNVDYLATKDIKTLNKIETKEIENSENVKNNTTEFENNPEPFEKINSNFNENEVEVVVKENIESELRNEATETSDLHNEDLSIEKVKETAQENIYIKPFEEIKITEPSIKENPINIIRQSTINYNNPEDDDEEVLSSGFSIEKEESNHFTEEQEVVELSKNQININSNKTIQTNEQEFEEHKALKIPETQPTTNPNLNNTLSDRISFFKSKTSNLNPKESQSLINDFFSFDEKCKMELIALGYNCKTLFIYNTLLNQSTEHEFEHFKFPAFHSFANVPPYIYLTGGKDTTTNKDLNITIRIRRQTETTFTFDQLSEMNEARCNHNLLYNEETDSIFAIGGSKITSVEEYNVKENKWGMLANLKSSRERPCSFVYNNEWLYVFLGFDRNINKFVSTIERFNLKTKSGFEEIKPKGPSNLLKKYGISVIRKDNDSIYVLGGINSFRSETKEVLVFSFNNNSFVMNKEGLESLSSFNHNAFMKPLGDENGEDDYYVNFNENFEILKFK